LIEHGIQEKIFEQVVRSLSEKGLIMKKGSIVDSTIIENSTSRRNKDKSCDPESKWTKKAGSYKHGYKAHISVDSSSGLVTSNKTTAANVHDVNIANELLHGEEEAVYGDSGYLGIENHRNALSARKYYILSRPSQINKLADKQQAKAKDRQRTISSIRAKVEHCFATVKRLFGWRRTRYRGLKKNSAKLNILFALSNLWKVSRVARAA
jgi:IS5 family transposase